MKKCPHCAEEIQDGAAICRFCNRSVVSRRFGLRQLVTFFAIIAGLVFLVTLGLRLGRSVDETAAHFRAPSSRALATAQTPAGTDYLALVRSGVLDFDGSVTIGNAFDHYKYFHGPERWNALQAKNGRTIVQVIGTVDLAKLDVGDVRGAIEKFELRLKEAAGFTAPAAEAAAGTEQMLTNVRKHFAKLEVTVEFVILQDGGFQLRTASAEAVKPDGTVSPELITTEEDVDKLLRAIYENDLPPTLLSVVLAGSVLK